jgi:hypothetical protein
MAFLEAVKLFSDFAARGELVPPDVAITQLGRVYNLLATPVSGGEPAAGPRAAEIAKLRHEHPPTPEPKKKDPRRA